MVDRLNRMKELGLKQVDLIRKLRERGIAIQAPELSSMLNGINTYPKAQRVLNEVDKILAEFD